MRIDDTAMIAAEYALRGLRLRADVRASNVANLNTPGFRAARVDFESALDAALRSGDVGRARIPAPVPAATIPAANGGTVDLEEELVGMLKDNLLRDAMVNAYNFKVGVLRAGIAGR